MAAQPLLLSSKNTYSMQPLLDEAPKQQIIRAGQDGSTPI